MAVASALTQRSSGCPALACTSFNGNDVGDGLMDRAIVRHERKGSLLSAMAALSGLSWLDGQERSDLDRLSDPRRRENWLCGRYLAKRTACELLRANTLDESAAAVLDDRELGEIRIQTRNASGQGVRPQVWHGNQLQPWALSISHCDFSVAVAATRHPALRVGIDVIHIPSGGNHRGLEFWMTATEGQWADECEREHGFELLWAMKEAAYKAMNTGEAFHPLEWEISELSSGTFRGVNRQRHDTACALRGILRGDEILGLALFEAYSPSDAVVVASSDQR